MPRTMPTYTGTPSYVVVSFRFVDANGQLTSTSYITTAARATTANIEAMAAALGEATNANLYGVSVEAITAAPTASPSAAVEAPRESARDFINTLVREPSTRKTQEVSIPAPLDQMLVEGSNEVDTSDSLYQAVNIAADALLPADYAFISTRFSEHRGFNKKKKI